MTERVIILGTGMLAREIAAECLRRGPGRYQVLGVISEAKDADLGGFACPHLGTVEDLQCILADWSPERIVVAPDEQHGNLPADLLVESQADSKLVVESGVEAYERLTGKLAIESLPAGTVLFSSEFRPARAALLFARMTSVLFACLGFVLCLPAMGLIAALIRIESRGSVLFVQDRVGLGGRRFKLLKFRSMRETTRPHSEWVEDNADRITRVGRWIRKFRLDELPQFVNVIRGDMNLVGPRPHPVSNRELFILVSRNTPQCGEQIPYYSLRSSIRPGITGWAQVRYKYANGLDEEMEKLRYDLYYIKHYSPLLDLRIFLETVKVVFLGPHHPARVPLPTPGPELEAAAPEPAPVLPGLAQALQSKHRRPASRRGADLASRNLSHAP
ncbi:MAG: sugar transferase [Bacillota bacterium]